MPLRVGPGQLAGCPLAEAVLALGPVSASTLKLTLLPLILGGVPPGLTQLMTSAIRSSELVEVLLSGGSGSMPFEVWKSSRGWT